MRYNLFGTINVSAGMLIATFAGVFFPQPGKAERMPTPSQAEIDKALVKSPMPSPGRIAAEIGKNQQDTERALRGAELGASNSKLNIAPGAGIDLNALVEQYQQNKHAFEPGALQAKQNEQQGLLVFVSFSMPAASLDRAIDQASKAGASLVVRGLIKPGDLHGSAEQMGRLLKDRKTSFLIDPTLFQKFGIKQIPSLVLLPGKTLPHCENNACNTPTPLHWAVSGDVSMDYALEAISRMAPEARVTTDLYLRRLRGGGFYDGR